MYTDLDGLGKFKLPKMKSIKKLLMTHPLAPTPVKMMALKAKKKAAPAIAPSVAEPVTLAPVEQIYQPYPQPPQYQAMPYPQPPQYQAMPYPQPPQYQAMPYPQPPQYAEPSPRAIPSDFYPLETQYGEEAFDTSLPAIENVPMISPYESAVTAQYGNEEDFMDTSAAYESEAGFLQGLGQEAGSSGGWFTDLISTGAKAYTEIEKAKAAAKAAKTPAPMIRPGGYQPTIFGGGFNLNTALMIGALGLGGFLLYNKFARKRR